MVNKYNKKMDDKILIGLVVAILSVSAYLQLWIFVFLLIITAVGAAFQRQRTTKGRKVTINCIYKLLLMIINGTILFHFDNCVIFIYIHLKKPQKQKQAGLTGKCWEILYYGPID